MNKVKNIFLVFFLGCSLQSYYYHKFGLPIISLLSLGVLFLLVLFVEKKDFFNINKVTLSIIILYCTLLLWSLLGGAISGDLAESNLKRVFSFVVMVISLIIAEKVVKIVTLKKMVVYFLIFHLCFFYTQFLFFYAFAIELDLLYFFSGEEQRTYGYTLPLLGKTIRPAGVFSEPGTYATFVAPFVALMSRWIKDSKIDSMVYWFGLFSLFISLSSFGIVFGIIILLWSRDVPLKYRITFLFLASAIVSPYLYFKFILGPEIGVNTGLVIREHSINNMIEFLFSDVANFIFGSSIIRIDPSVTGNDVGLLPYLLHNTGVLFFIPLIMLAIYVFFVVLNRESKVALTIILLSKQSIFVPFFVFTLIAVLFPITKLEQLRVRCNNG